MVLAPSKSSDDVEAHIAPRDEERSVPWWRRAYKRQSVGLIVGGLLFLFLHYLALWHFRVGPEDQTVWADVARVPLEVGFAFIIAAVLNLVVEPNTQRRHEDLERAVTDRLTRASDELNLEVRKNVLRAVFKQNLGDYVIGQIESKLFQPGPYRVTAYLSYGLGLKKDEHTGTDCVCVEANIRYAEYNASRRSAPLAIGLVTDSPEEFKHYLRLESVKVDDKDLVDAGSAKSLVHGGSLEYREENGVEMEPGSTHSVEIAFHRADYAAGTETYVSRLAIETLEVHVSHSDQLRVWAMSLHPDEPEVIGRTSTSKGWRLRGLMPGQGLSISWARKAALEISEARPGP
ncbi:MAG TPA: hypothetical protein VMB19_11340 [Silvibacterium sp.]|nr:hypothetical protein [Silvibacterium sp.]